MSRTNKRTTKTTRIFLVANSKIDIKKVNSKLFDLVRDLARANCIYLLPEDNTSRTPTNLSSSKDDRIIIITGPRFKTKRSRRVITAVTNNYLVHSLKLGN